jgi:dihydroxynaphthoic acid synthetase
MTSTKFEAEDVLYEKIGSAAVVTINRPDRMNSFRARTFDELVDAFYLAWGDDSVRAVILTGSGTRAFCVGGDVKTRNELGNYGPSRLGFIQADLFHRQIREIPKPVIAAVNGFAIGGGHVFHVLCDMSIASSTARFGQAGPRVGSFDAGFGTAYLARLVGEKRAREIWFMCRQYSAQDALAMGLVNAVVEPEQLMTEALSWAEEIALMSPTAIKMVKYSFNIDTERMAGVANFATGANEMFTASAEAAEGALAFVEKRPPNFAGLSQ